MTQVPEWRRNAPPGVFLASICPPAPGKPAAAKMVIPAARTDEAPMLRIVKPETRSRWRTWLASTYTPSRVEWILRDAMAGDHVSQWELFDLMEDTWPRLAKNLSELKRAVASYQWSVEPWAEQDEPPTDSAKERQALVTKAIWTMKPTPGTVERGFMDTITDVMDAWGKGTTLIEIEWELRSGGKLGEIVAPRCTRWVHPLCYAWSADGDWLGLQPGSLLSGAQVEALRDGLVPLPEHKFLTAIAPARTVHPLVGAMLRPLAWWWCASNFNAEWFLNFCQIFGLPIRWATYDPSRPGLLDQICDMLENMGSAGWGAFPAGTTLELKEPAKGGTDNPQVTLMDRADRQCDILILGQTLTTSVDQSGSRALGEVHMGVRNEVVKAAADWVSDILTSQLVPAILELNYGDADEAPEISAQPEKVEDEKANADRDAVLLGAGIEMPKAWFYERHKVPMPQKGEDVIGKPAPGPFMPFDPLAAAAAAVAKTPPDAAALIAARRREVLGQAYRGAMVPFREAILASSSPEDCERRLRTLYADWTPDRLAAELDGALQLCAAHGAAL